MGKLSKKQKDRIIQLDAEGYTHKEIAETTGHDPKTVSKVLREENKLTLKTEVYSTAFQIFEKGGNAIDAVKDLNIQPAVARSLFEEYLSLRPSVDVDTSNSMSVEFEVFSRKRWLTDQCEMLLGVLDCFVVELVTERKRLEDRVAFLQSRIGGLDSTRDLAEVEALLVSLESELKRLLDDEHRVHEKKKVDEEMRRQREKEKRFEWMVGRVMSKGYSKRGAEKFVQERAVSLKGGLQGVYKILSKLEKMR
ncbi:MAG: hypothetical protein NWE89_15375 [Candidatus Bathyarchaeota archaeon]|nr:hypothetical protein [Candidatus Bathyarchaeota archaeon]